MGDEVMPARSSYLLGTREAERPVHRPLPCRRSEGDVNVELELPPSLRRLHPVFHVDRLKRYVRSTVEWPGREQQDRPPPELVDGEQSGRWRG